MRSYLTYLFCIALVFTFGCSDDGDDNPNPGGGGTDSNLTNITATFEEIQQFQGPVNGVFGNITFKNTREKSFTGTIYGESVELATDETYVLYNRILFAENTSQRQQVKDMPVTGNLVDDVPLVYNVDTETPLINLDYDYNMTYQDWDVDNKGIVSMTLAYELWNQGERFNIEYSSVGFESQEDDLNEKGLVSLADPLFPTPGLGYSTTNIPSESTVILTAFDCSFFQPEDNKVFYFPFVITGTFEGNTLTFYQFEIASPELLAELGQ